MAKSKKGSKENPINAGELQDLLTDEKQAFEIISASIKDDFCNYTYEIKKGVGQGRIHKVDGKSGGLIVDDDMLKAFAKFNVHLAVIDDVYKHSGIEIDDIDKFHTHELTGLFEVSGFKIGGNDENENIILAGTKYVSNGGYMEIDSIKVALDNLSSYKWYNELKVAADNARMEVQLYEGGKGTAAEPEEPKEKLRQGKLSLFDATFNVKSSDKSDDKEGTENDDMSDFEKAKA